MKFVGLMRVKNGARWIEESLESLQPLCSSILVFDDHSTDDTVAICRKMYAQVIESPYESLGETRDKTRLLREAAVLKPDWVFWIDADEVLERNGADKIRRYLANCPGARVLSAHVPYYWNDTNTVRVDGSFNRLIRPTAFRMSDLPYSNMEYSNHGYSRGGLHCGCIPAALSLVPHHAIGIALWHYGYIDADLRRSKFDWYNRVDGGNPSEDWYQHIIQGDPGGPPAKATLKHAGPLTLQSVDDYNIAHNFSKRPREH